MTATVQEFWDKIHAQRRSDIAGPLQAMGEGDPVLKAALAHFGDVRGKRIMDLGCGNGKTSLFFASRGASVLSVDVSRVAMDNLKAFCESNGIRNITPVQASALQIADFGPVDFVFGSLILHHIEPFAAFAAGLRKAIVPGGRAFFYENNANSSLMIWCRKHIVGKFWVPKHGDSEEFPLTREEIGVLRQHFHTRTHYPELMLFRMISIYILRDGFMGFFKRLDDFFYRKTPGLRKYSYWQYLYLS